MCLVVDLAVFSDGNCSKNYSGGSLCPAKIPTPRRGLYVWDSVFFRTVGAGFKPAPTGASILRQGIRRIGPIAENPDLIEEKFRTVPFFAHRQSARHTISLLPIRALAMVSCLH
jgi:hypothetical protein